MSAEETEAYRKVIRAMASATMEFSETAEKMLTTLKKLLHIDEDVHMACLMEVIDDPEVTEVRNAVEEAGGMSAVAALVPVRQQKPPVLQRAVPITASKGPSLSRRDAQPAGSKKPKTARVSQVPAAAAPEPLLPAPPLSKRLSRKPLPPPPTFTQGAALTSSIPRSPFSPKLTPPTSPVPYPPQDFTARVSTSSRPELEAMLAALTQREEAIHKELADIDRLEQQPQPSAPTAPKAAASQGKRGPSLGFRGGAAQVAVAAGMSAKELQSTLQQLQEREEKIVDELLGMDISDDEDLDEESKLRLRWHTLGRREAQIQAELESIERELAA